MLKIYLAVYKLESRKEQFDSALKGLSLLLPYVLLALA